MTPEEAVTAAVAKTGFLLEHRVSETLTRHGWTVIQNRYYIDDVDGRAREIDILAYKQKKGKFVENFTALVVSCKKDDEHHWAFLTKDKPVQDPNHDWTPLTFCTTDDLSKRVISDSDFSQAFRAAESKSVDISTIPKYVFAFQQVGKGGQAKNDRAIFDSIAGLLKAQQFEIEGLRKKGRPARVTSFHLLTVVEAKMFEAFVDAKGACAVTAISETKFLARYIVNKESVNSRVHFVSLAAFEAVLKQYDKLPDIEAGYFNSSLKPIYENWAKDAALKTHFEEVLRPIVWQSVRHYLKTTEEDFRSYFEMSRRGDLVDFAIPTDGETLEKLNAAPKPARIAEALKEQLHFDGAFIFSQSWLHS